MHRHISRNTVRVDCRTRRRNRTLRHLQITPCEAAYTGMNIPHTAWQATRGRKVPLDENRTLCWPCVLTIISLHSTCPVDPVMPTCTTGWGLFMLLKKEPEDMITA